MEVGGGKCVTKGWSDCNTGNRMQLFTVIKKYLPPLLPSNFYENFADAYSGLPSTLYLFLLKQSPRVFKVSLCLETFPFLR
jgi:hypothetical protein